ncbi:hypothetical protein NMD1_00296 [Novosphingobium sp. MD-1]|nr:hypothetical protein NMD1_00296 [Novosphingobium sp. MD-1]
MPCDALPAPVVTGAMQWPYVRSRHGRCLPSRLHCAHFFIPAFAGTAQGEDESERNR